MVYLIKRKKDKFANNNACWYKSTFEKGKLYLSVIGNILGICIEHDNQLSCVFSEKKRLTKNLTFFS